MQIKSIIDILPEKTLSQGERNISISQKSNLFEQYIKSNDEVEEEKDIYSEEGIFSEEDRKNFSIT